MPVLRSVSSACAHVLPRTLTGAKTQVPMIRFSCILTDRMNPDCSRGLAVPPSIECKGNSDPDLFILTPGPMARIGRLRRSGRFMAVTSEMPAVKRDSTVPRSGVRWNRTMAGEPPFGQNNGLPANSDGYDGLRIFGVKTFTSAGLPFEPGLGYYSDMETGTGRAWSLADMAPCGHGPLWTWSLVDMVPCGLWRGCCAAGSPFRFRKFGFKKMVPAIQDGTASKLPF
jgi:hypothetical protein